MSQNIINLIKNAGNINTNDKLTSNKEVIAFLVDNSGSTGSYFSTHVYDYNNPKNNANIKTVLEKELELVKNYILFNNNNNKNEYHLFNFESSSKYLGKINYLSEEDLVELPVLRPAGGTETLSGLMNVLIYNNQFKFNRIILLTDGQTNNNNFDKVKNELKKLNIILEVIAVANTQTNMNNISENEQNNLAGMDLLLSNNLGNAIDLLKIYNLYHIQVPYIGAASSKIDKTHITFFNVKLDIAKNIPDFLHKLLDNLIKTDNINWELNSDDNQEKTIELNKKKFISELGKLLTLLFSDIDESHYFVNKIYQTLNKATGLELDRVKNILNYGFNCTKNEQPVLYTNFDAQVVKSGNVKRSQFTDAVNLLNTYGTTLNGNYKVSLPNKGLCVIDNTKFVKLTKPLGSYPNSIDDNNNTYYYPEGEEQALRIGLREFCKSTTINNPGASPVSVFYILAQMTLLYVKGFDLSHPYMQELKKLAIAQTSYEIVIESNKYDGHGCYKQWKNGNMMFLHHSTPNLTHLSLFADPVINPLGLTQTVWWATCMSLLDLYDEQSKYYQSSLKVLCNNNNLDKNTFLQFMRDTYKDNVVGNPVYVNFEKQKHSVFTLGPFELNNNEKLFLFKDHGECKTKTIYSNEELDLFVKKNGCVWCHHIPTEDDLTEISYEEHKKLYENALKEAVPLSVVNIKLNDTKLLENLLTEMNKTMSNNRKTNYSNPKQVNKYSYNNNPVNPNVKSIRIDLMGTIGSGKTYYSNLLKTELENKNYKVLLINPGAVIQQMKIYGKPLNSYINGLISTFDKDHSNDNKAIIIDMCNDGQTNIRSAFGFNFNNYKYYTFVPNFVNNTDDYKQFTNWSLYNVLQRDKSSESINLETTHITKIIEVFNLKTSGCANKMNINYNIVFNSKNKVKDVNNTLIQTDDELKKLIQKDYEDYNKVVQSRDHKKIVLDFITKENL